MDLPAGKISHQEEKLTEPDLRHRRPDPALRRDRPRVAARQSDRGRIRDIGHPPRGAFQVAIARSASAGERGDRRHREGLTMRSILAALAVLASAQLADAQGIYMLNGAGDAIRDHRRPMVPSSRWCRACSSPALRP